MSTITENSPNCILIGEQYGVAISEKLSETIKRYTDNGDQANVTISLREKGINVGTSTIRGVIYRNNSLTESNAIAIEEMARIAIKNCEMEIEDAKLSKSYLNKTIKGR